MLDDRLAIGGNNPPDPIDEALAPYADEIAEAENWLDGEPVQNAEQMDAVDELLKAIKSASKDVGAARDEATKPLHAVWKEEVARWKPTIDDLERLKKGLAAAGNDFKKRLAMQKERERAAAMAEARRKEEEAKRAAETAAASDIEAQRVVAAKLEEAKEAQQAATDAKRDTVKGLRTKYLYDITDLGAVVNWIARHDKAAMGHFAAEYVRQHYRKGPIAGVHTWEDKEAF